MMIEYIQFVKDNHDTYIINGSLSVPKAPGNRHYRDVLEWIEAGNKTEPPDHTLAELEERERQAVLETQRREKYINALEHLVNIKIAEIAGKSLSQEDVDGLIKLKKQRQ